jgi:DNA-binding transcriptional regulator YhcF (GntR family)
MGTRHAERTDGAHAYGPSRLRSKTAREAIIHAIGRDFNLTPIIAEAYFSQIATYFGQHADVSLGTGQVCYEAVSIDEPAGKHIALASRVSTKLTLFDVQVDLTVLAEHGLAGLRQHRILRMTREAVDQKALLSYEDLAMLLTISPATVRRDARQLRKDGKVVMTRGWKHDMGPGTSHKAQIIDLYLKGYQFTEIELKTNHSENSVRRYLRDFVQVIALHHQHFSLTQIRQVTGFSERLVREYLDLYDHFYQEKNDRLALLLEPASPEKRGPKETQP